MRASGLIAAGPAGRLPLSWRTLGPGRAWAALRVHVMAGPDRRGPRAAVAKAAPAAAAAPEGGAFEGESFERVVLPHLDAAYNLARFLTRDADAADDVVQEACLRAFRAYGGFRGGDARAWLLAIVRNCVRGWANERVRACADPLPAAAEPGAEEAAEVWDPDQDTPETALLREGQARLVRRLVEALPEAFREVLVLREFDDLSYRQIAEVAAIPVGTVMSRLARARQMFGIAWRRNGGDTR